MRFIAAMLLVFATACGPTNNTAATSCRKHDECKSMTKGYCAKAEICTRDCADVACPDRMACVSEGTRRVCLPICATNDDCPKGFTCQAKEGSSVCRLEFPLKPPPT